MTYTVSQTPPHLMLYFLTIVLKPYGKFYLEFRCYEMLWRKKWLISTNMCLLCAQSYNFHSCFFFFFFFFFFAVSIKTTGLISLKIWLIRLNEHTPSLRERNCAVFVNFTFNLKWIYHWATFKFHSGNQWHRFSRTPKRNNLDLLLINKLFSNDLLQGCLI